MLGGARQQIKRLMKRSGWLVERYRPYRDRFRLLTRLCSDHRCQLLVDVGANEGQFALEMLEAGYEGEILSIEPQQKAHQALSERANETAHWIVPPRMCIGDQNGTASINIAANSVSSSVLDVLAASIEAEPGTRFVGHEDVPMRRLDDWLSEFRPGKAPIALKLDVQGFEREVLSGAANIVRDIQVLVLEMSLAPLYEDAATFTELFGTLESAGFKPAGIFPGFTDPRSMRMLQVDGVFERAAVAA